MRPIFLKENDVVKRLMTITKALFKERMPCLVDLLTKRGSNRRCRRVQSCQEDAKAQARIISQERVKGRRNGGGSETTTLMQNPNIKTTKIRTLSKTALLMRRKGWAGQRH